MRISKISRSIIVVIFIAIVLGLICVDFGIKYIGTKVTLLKFCFVIVTILLTFVYACLKDKLYKDKVKKNKSLLYKYIFLIAVVIISKLITLKNLYSSISFLYYLAIFVISSAIAICIKKLVFNISKSDILSVLALIMYATMPNVINDKYLYFISAILLLSVLGFALYILKLIDELKEQGIKNKRYMIYSLIAGGFASVAIILGVNVYAFIITFIIMFLIGSNIDVSHITFPKKLLNKLSEENRERLYKIERIRISKLVISEIIMIAEMTLCVLVINTILKIFINGYTYNILCNRVNFASQFNIVSGFGLLNIQNLNLKFASLLATSRNYYLVIFIYIAFIELFAIFLKRKYDIKSTFFKLLAMLIFTFYGMYELNMYIYQPLFTILNILIAVINTSNIYLNREERIKLLKASDINC